jgi:hypothetical protein
MSSTNSDILNTRCDALVGFVATHPEVPVCGAAWNSAFLAGYTLGLEQGRRCSVCLGAGRVKIHDGGWCRCPKCAPFAHKRGHAGHPACGHEHDGDSRNRSHELMADEWHDVTCIDCLMMVVRVQPGE